MRITRSLEEIGGTVIHKGVRVWITPGGCDDHPGDDRRCRNRGRAYAVLGPE